MTYGELSKELAERRKRAGDIVIHIQKLGYECELDKVLRNFDVFDRWKRGNLSTGYLLKMVHLKPVSMEKKTYDALRALQTQLEANKCECLEARKALDMVAPLAEHIRSIQCNDCGKFLFIRDEAAARTTREAMLYEYPYHAGCAGDKWCTGWNEAGGMVSA